MENKIMIGYAWFLSVIGAAFMGNEIAMMSNESKAVAMNNKLQQCNQVIARNLYESP